VTDFRLTEQEKDSALWKRIEIELRRRLDEHREGNDSASNTESDTAKLRGRIAEIKHLLAWLDEPPRHIEDARTY
jgi:hypothetical protein